MECLHKGNFFRDFVQISYYLLATNTYNISKYNKKILTYNYELKFKENNQDRELESKLGVEKTTNS